MLSDVEKTMNKAAAASPQTLVISDRTFLVPPLKLSDFFAQKNRAREELIAEAEDPIEVVNNKLRAAEKEGRPYSPALIKALTESALAAAASKTRKQEPTDPQINEQMGRPSHLRWWVWYLCHKADPSVTLDEINKLIGPTDDDVLNLSHRVGELMMTSLAGLNPN